MIFTEDRDLVDGIFSSVMGSQDMNHIEYKIFNSIQVDNIYIVCGDIFMNDKTLIYLVIYHLNFFMNQDPANEQTENHYKGLQAKVADAVRLQIRNPVD